jgi:hypothetical protein
LIPKSFDIEHGDVSITVFASHSVEDEKQRLSLCNNAFLSLVEYPLTELGDRNLDKRLLPNLDWSFSIQESVQRLRHLKNLFLSDAFDTVCSKLVLVSASGLIKHVNTAFKMLRDRSTRRPLGLLTLFKLVGVEAPGSIPFLREPNLLSSHRANDQTAHASLESPTTPNSFLQIEEVSSFFENIFAPSSPSILHVSRLGLSFEGSDIASLGDSEIFGGFEPVIAVQSQSNPEHERASTQSSESNSEILSSLDRHAKQLQELTVPPQLFLESINQFLSSSYPQALTISNPSSDSSSIIQSRNPGQKLRSFWLPVQPFKKKRRSKNKNVRFYSYTGFRDDDIRRIPI